MSGELDLEGGGTHTGTFTAAPGGVLTFAGGTHNVSGAAAAIGGAGTIQFGGGTATINGGSYAVTGTTRVSGGSNHLVAAGVNVSSVGALVVSGGTFDLSGGEMVTVPSYLQTGGSFGGSDIVTVMSTTEWHAGSMAGSGTTNAQGGLTITSDGPISLLDTRTLNNATLGIWMGAFSFQNQASATLRNLPAASFTIATSADFFNGNFLNEGTLTKMAGTGDGITRITGAFNNSGSVTVTSGELDLEGGGTHSGTFSVELGGTFAFAGGMHTVNGANAAVGGAGTVDFSGGTAVLNGGAYDVTGTTRVSSGGTHSIGAAVDVTSVGALVISGGSLALSGGEPVTVPSYLQTGGTLRGSDTVTVSGTLEWHGGVMSGTGVTNAAGGLMIATDATIGLTDTRTLNNRAMGTWTGGFNFSNNASARLVNLAGGTFSIATSADFVNGNLVNQGTLIKTTGTGDGVTRIAGTLSNSGLIDIQSGVLDVNSFAQSAGVTRLNGGSLESNSAININGGRLEGNGTVTGTVINAGEVSPGLSPGSIDIVGAYQQAAGGRYAVELGGLTPATQFDRLTVANAATLGGTLAVSLVNGFTPTIGDSFEVMTFASRSGEFSASNGLVTGIGLGFRPIISNTSVRLRFGQEICDDGQDNDGDGQADCADIKCAGFVPCSFTPTVTPTPTATGTSTASTTATGTATPLSSATETPSPSPTPSVTPAAACVGDCNGNLVVTIDALIRAVNIALGATALDTCRAADQNHDGSVTINELIAAVNNALNACPGSGTR